MDEYDLIKKKTMVDSYDDLEVVPIKKQKKVKKILNKRVSKLGIGFAVFLFALFGVSYSYFNYTKIDSRQADIASGEIYVRLVEDETSITLSKMYPRTNEEARSRNDNYFDFTIKAKNTSSLKSVLYSIEINNGENISNKTRIDPQYIKLDLQEKVGNEYVYIKEGVSLDGYSFTGIVPTNTTSEMTKEYRIRIWIGDNLTISDTDANASYTESQYNNLYANFDISVTSIDKKVAYDIFSKDVDTNTTINFANISSSSNGEGLYILPGTENDTYPIYFYRGNINNNNVIFGGFCWQIVRTTDTGGIKMIYNGQVTGDGKTCENTTHASRIISSGAYSSNLISLADVGYMYNKRYSYTCAEAETDSIFGKNIEWDGTNYLIIDDTSGVPSTNTTLNSTHHYTCGTSGTNSCSTVRYYFAIRSSTYYYYISLTNGETLDDAIYKMTGNGSTATKSKNADYTLNDKNSNIKTIVDNWFKANLTNEVDDTKTDYMPFIEDTVYCNERNFKASGNGSLSTSGWNPNGGSLTVYLHYGISGRFLNSWYSTTNVPIMTCQNETDRFSVSNSLAKLNYPVGLLTVDEMILAGASGNDNVANTSYYLYTGGNYWSMSPNYYNSLGNATVRNNPSSGYIGSANVTAGNGIRPVISLKLGVKFESGGDGTPTNPYVVKYN